MTTDDETLRRYREASAALDERPAPAARASILAAAAREVGARPRAADAPRVSRLRMRWPLAAAATVMLSTLAVMLASRTEHEIGTFTAPTDASTATTPETPTAPPTPATPAQPAPPATSAPEPTIAPASPKVEAPGARMQRPAETRAAPATPPRQEERQREAPPRSDVPAARDQERAGGTASAPSPASAAPATPAAPMRETPAMQRGVAAESAKPSAAPPDARREAADAALSSVEMSAAQWLERIVQLRAAGRHDEADAELKRFTERYPQVQVPAAARAPTATR